MHEPKFKSIRCRSQCCKILGCSLCEHERSHAASTHWLLKTCRHRETSNLLVFSRCKPNKGTYNVNMKRPQSKPVLVCTRIDFVTWFQSSWQCSTMMDFEAPPVLGRNLGFCLGLRFDTNLEHKSLQQVCMAFGPLSQDQLVHGGHQEKDRQDWQDKLNHHWSYELLFNALMCAHFETQEAQVNQCLKRSCWMPQGHSCCVVLRCPPNCQGWRWRVAAMILRTNLGIPELTDDKHPWLYR